MQADCGNCLGGRHGICLQVNCPCCGVGTEIKPVRELISINRSPNGVGKVCRYCGNLIEPLEDFGFRDGGKTFWHIRCEAVMYMQRKD